MMSKNPKHSQGYAEISKARLGKAQSAKMFDYVWTSFADVDADNIAAMVQLNMAHTVMLSEQKIITEEEAALILKALLEFEDNVESFSFDPKKGDLFLNVEAYVIERTGREIGGKMHLGRGRVDLIGALMRLKVRKNLSRLLTATMALRAVLLERAEETADAVMPAYTHLQPAQVTTFGHYLAAFYDVATRDLNRLLVAFEGTNLSPLGAAASSGTSWPLNRERVAELVGFAAVIENVKDAGHNYDWMPEAIAAAAILMNNIARVASDLYIWCTNEFSLVEIDSAYAAGSSILPQKKNPYSLEMIKARTGEVHAAFATVLEILKGDTGGTAFDIKLTGPQVANNALNRVADMVMLLTPIIKTLQLNREQMLATAGDAFTTALGLADRLVQTGLSFRTAHLIVGTVVKRAVEQKLGYRDVNSALLNEAAQEVAGHDVDIDDAAIQEALDPRGFIIRGSGDGGPAPDEVMKMITKRRKSNVEIEKRVQAVLALVDDADRKLRMAVDRLTR